MSQAEINKNLEEKKSILSWLIKNNLRSLPDYGKIVSLYYTDKDLIKSAIAKNEPRIALTK